MYTRWKKQMIVAALASVYDLIDDVGGLERGVPDEGEEEEYALRKLVVNDMRVDLSAVAEALETELTR